MLTESHVCDAVLAQLNRYPWMTHECKTKILELVARDWYHGVIRSVKTAIDVVDVHADCVFRIGWEHFDNYEGVITNPRPLTKIQPF